MVGSSSGPPMPATAVAHRSPTTRRNSRRRSAGARAGSVEEVADCTVNSFVELVEALSELGAGFDDGVS